MRSSGGASLVLWVGLLVLEAALSDAWQAASASAGFVMLSQPRSNAPFACSGGGAFGALASTPLLGSTRGQQVRGYQRRDRHALLMSSTEQQPQQWEELVDEGTGSTYYWNQLTGETQWEKPEALQAGAAVSGGDSTGFSSTDDYAEIEECSKFFVDAFWVQGTTLGELSLSAKQKNAILQEQKRDMENRYGRLLGDRKLSSSLILSRDDSGAIVGCVGVEIAVADKESGAIMSRDAGEQLLNGGLAALGGRQRNIIRKAGLTELALAVLPADKGLIPVLSNLAVGPGGRGQGLGRRLCEAAEGQARRWGFGELLLKVEAANAPASALYASLGYKEVGRASVKTVRIGAEDIETAMVETVTMAKQL